MILGASGTAKTSTVLSISKEFGFPVETLLLAGISPEDVGGMPRPDDMNNPKNFKYLAPEWFIKHKGKPFVLFLDEFNQASIDTMHAIFSLVNDKVTAGQHNPEMRVVAVGNCDNENEFLTPVPLPLKDRFLYQIKWQNNLEYSLKFLSKKYKSKIAKDIIKIIKESGNDELTARHVEQAICMIEDGVFDVERGRELLGGVYDIYIENINTEKKHVEDERLKYLADIKKKLSNNYIIEDGRMVSVNEKDLTIGLTDEEKEIIKYE